MSNSTNTRTGKRQIRAIARQTQALELREQGHTYEYIRDHTDYKTRGGAHRAVMAALKRTQQTPADEVRKLESRRLDRLQTAVWEKAMTGDKDAVLSALRILERRARLLGLDLPFKIAPTGPEGKVPWSGMKDELANRLALILANRAATGVPVKPE